MGNGELRTRGLETDRAAVSLDGVDDGARTRDRRDHNPELYQLSYVHHQLL